jgi:hypothetical protein
MAAAEPTAVPIYIPLLVAALPVILSPIVVWALGRSRISKESATIDYLNKRLDFLERLNKLRTQLADGPIRPFLDTEIEHCEAFLRQPRTSIPRSAEMEVAAPQSRLARFFLTQPAVSTRKRVFKGLFYFFFGIVVLSLPSIPIVLLSERSREDSSFIISFGLGFVFYLVIALLFRRAAR